MHISFFFFQMILPHSLFKHEGENLKWPESPTKFSLLSASNLPGNPSRRGFHSNSAHVLLAPKPIYEPGGGLALSWAAAGTACKHETRVN